MNPIEKYAKLLESLKVKDEGPADMHGYKFSIPLPDICPASYKEIGQEFYDYLYERCLHAEARAIPENLAEDFKEVVADALHAGFKQGANGWNVYEDYEEYRRLSEPEGKQ